MAKWIETKVRFDKVMENGTVKRITESYLVDAMSFTEAEARITKEVAPFISGEFSVSAVKKTNIAEIFYNPNGDRWYKVKVVFITIDERTATEKKQASYILVQASDFKNAYDMFSDGMNGTMADYEIAAISETTIMDVFKAVI